MKQRSKQAFG